MQNEVTSVRRIHRTESAAKCEFIFLKKKVARKKSIIKTCGCDASFSCAKELNEKKLNFNQ